MSAGVSRIYQACNVLPFVATVVIAVYFMTWMGAIAGIVVGGSLAQVWDAIRRRMDARAAFAAWGSYIDPGFTGKIKYQTTKKRAPRRPGTRNEDYDFEQEEWLLADGALLECVKGGRFEETPDRRYLAARWDEAGASFVLYDQTERVTYDYKEDDAPVVFAALFGADSAARAGALAAVFSKAERTALIEFRGLWLVETSLLFTPETVLKKEIAPRLMLTATLALPDDCTTLDDPLDVLDDPVRRLGVNGFATPYLCRDLTSVLASDDGVCLIVNGVVVYPDCQCAGQRWYYRGRDAAWTTLEDCLRDASGKVLCRLLSIESLSATSAVFNIDPDLEELGSGYLQASSRALPFKVGIDKSGATPTCVVPLQKFA